MNLADGLADIFTETFGEPDAPARYVIGDDGGTAVVGIYRERSEVTFDDSGMPGMRTRVPTFDCAEADLPPAAAPGEHSPDVLEVSGFVARANGSFALQPDSGVVTRRFAVRGATPSGVTGMVRLTLEVLTG